jgi:hypothetical protein
MIRTVDQVVAVYGGEKKLCEAFRLKKGELETWRKRGVPRSPTLGLFLGLQLRGHEASPRFGAALPAYINRPRRGVD